MPCITDVDKPSVIFQALYTRSTKKITIKIQISTLINNIPVTVPLPLLSLSFFTQMQLSGEDQKPPEVIKVSYRAREVRSSSPGAPLPDASPAADAATGEGRRDGRKH